MDDCTGHTRFLGNKPESIMTKTSVRIGAFEIDDAELRGEAQGERTLSIPCKSDPICACNWTPGMQIPASRRSLMGNIPFCTVNITTVKPMPGSCVLHNPKRTRPKAGYLLLKLRQRQKAPNTAPVSM